MTPSPRLAPLATGKLVRIKKLDVPPLEILVPPTFKLRMEGGEELAPVAYLEDGNLKISIAEPEGGFFTLQGDKGMISRGQPETIFIHAYETEDGYVLVDRNNLNGPSTYEVGVSRPKLKVECGAIKLNTAAEAERVASICLTLRAAPEKSANP